MTHRNQNMSGSLCTFRVRLQQLCLNLTDGILAEHTSGHWPRAIYPGYSIALGCCLKLLGRVLLPCCCMDQCYVVLGNCSIWEVLGLKNSWELSMGGILAGKNVARFLEQGIWFYFGLQVVMWWWKWNVWRMVPVKLLLIQHLRVPPLRQVLMIHIDLY